MKIVQSHDAGAFQPRIFTTTTTNSLQSCLTLCDPIDGSPPGSSVHGSFQVRVLEWVAIAFSAQNLWVSSKISYTATEIVSLIIHSYFLIINTLH